VVFPKTPTVLIQAPKECWDNDFEDEGSDIWQIPENITDAQDKLKGYLSNIRTFSGLIDDLKRFRESYPRANRLPISQELLDEIDAMIEISTLDGFTPPPFSGPLPSPKKSNTSLASSQWSFEDRFASFTIDDERELPTPPPPAMTDSNTLDFRDLQARRLLEKILGESDDARMEVKPEQLTKMIDYVAGLKDRCDEFNSLDGVQESWNIGLGVYV
jgi:Septation protein etd1